MVNMKVLIIIAGVLAVIAAIYLRSANQPRPAEKAQEVEYQRAHAPTGLTGTAPQKY